MKLWPWAAWLGAVLISFGLMEAHGFRVGTRWPTLSEALASWIRPAPRTLALLFVGFWIGLTWHVLNVHDRPR